MGTLRSLLIMGRVSNLPTVWTNVLAAWFLAGGTWEWPLLWATIAGSVFYIGGMVQNDLMDAKWDTEHGKDRPLAKGAIGTQPATVFFILTTGLGMGLFWGIGAHWGWILGLLGAITLYNWLHKRWVGSMWIMGACRALLFLTAASILEPMPNRQVWFWAAALMIYVAGVTLAARGENTGGLVKILAQRLLTLPAGLAVVMMLTQGQILVLAMIVIFMGWRIYSYRVLSRQPGNIGAFVASLLAGMVLVDAMAVTTVNLTAGLVCVALLPVNLFFQRYVPAT